MTSSETLSEGETVALIHHYGSQIAGAHAQIGGTSRSDVTRWAERVAQLAKNLPDDEG